MFGRVGVAIGGLLAGVVLGSRAVVGQSSSPPVAPPPDGGPACLAVAFERAIPPGEREAVTLVESRVGLFPNATDAAEAVEELVAVVVAWRRLSAWWRT